ncbi:TetR/AcrR family transcriptional regulator [Mycobacterium sp. URHB0044]|jgi:AcrR family transcriptional regulator|uniref:TetR/AcrR family transcriptional regulator n=1 Tax=Mycobacterium sp. URHB0044 TaxID=1380386 RepID=UPI000685E194|nr:TetR/AcrR family transcriptional regulator [Mycobacterium sp. URHB0044]
MAGKREAQRENAIDLMCQVAIHAIGKGGYAAMTLAEVGELAGYSRGLATHHFGSKAGLLTALLDRVLDKNGVEFRKATEGKRGLARLAAVVDCTLYRCIQTPDEARAYLMLALEPTAKWAAAQVREQTAALREQAESSAREAIALGELSPQFEPAEVASLTLSMARGYAYEWAADPSTDLNAARRRINHYISSLAESGGPPVKRKASSDE